MHQKNLKTKKIIFTVSLIISFFIVGSFGYVLGRDSQVGSTDSWTSIFSPKEDIFSQVYSSLKENFIGSIDSEQGYYGAIKGFVASLNDPYTAFFDPEEAREFRNELEGAVDGIGVRLMEEEEFPVVVSVIDPSPAKRAGVMAKDIITEVDGKSVQGKSIDEVVALVRGKEGSEVAIKILRKGENDTLEFKIKREKIKINSVESKVIDGVGIYQISEFAPDTAQLLEDQARKNKEAGIDKFILDLRDNPGGLLDQAVEISNQIFPRESIVVIEEDRKGNKVETKTTQDGFLKQDKLIVLINGGSASASEIIAGAVKDNKRGTVLGEKSYGKGTVQQYEEFSDGSSLKVTISKWLTPSGKDINKNGISPDIEVKNEGQIGFDKGDPVISRAIEELNK